VFQLWIAKIWHNLLQLPKNDFDLKEEEYVLSLQKCPPLLEERVYNRTLADESVHTDVKPNKSFGDRYWLFYQRRKMYNMRKVCYVYL